LLPRASKVVVVVVMTSRLLSRGVIAAWITWNWGRYIYTLLFVVVRGGAARYKSFPFTPTLDLYHLAYPYLHHIHTKNNTMSNQLVLVTGISGFVATHVALEYLKNGHPVRGTVRSKEKGEVVKKTPCFQPYLEQLSFVVVEDLVTGDFSEAGESRVFFLGVVFFVMDSRPSSSLFDYLTDITHFPLSP
jgi:hypothetical protein